MTTLGKRMNHKLCARLMAPAMAVLLLGLLQPAAAEVELPSGYYHTTVEDLTVKVLGGHVSASRTWYRGRWQFNRAWNNLKIEYDALSGEIRAITRNLDVYEPSGSSTELFVYDARYTIRKTAAGFRWQDRKGNWIEYDSAGHITKYGDRNNVTVSFGYDDAGQRNAVFDHHGRQVLWYEYSNGRVSAVRDYTQPTPRRVEYTWGDGKLTAVKDVLGNVWSYSYSGGELTQIKDPEGRPTNIAYHEESGSSTSGGFTGAVSSGSGGSGTTAAFYASDSGDSIEHARRVASVTLADGTGPRYVYDYDSTKKEFYVKKTESSGKVTEQWYDREGYLIREDINGTTVGSILYSSDRRRKTTTNELGHKTVEEYDEHRNRTKITYPDGATKSWSYDPVYTKVLKETNELGVVTQYTYDANGNLAKLVEALGKPAERTTTYEYDQYGQLIKKTGVGDANTATTAVSYTYDVYGNLKTETDPEDYITTYVSYNAAGNLLAWSDARGKRWRRTFDLGGRLTGETDPLGRSVTYEYDGAGKVVKRLDAEGHPTSFVYDGSSRLVKVVDALGGAVVRRYDSKGQLVKIVDQEGVAEFYEYDEAGNLVSVADAYGNAVRLTYGEVHQNARTHQVSRMQYPSYATSVNYDPRGRLIRLHMEANDGSLSREIIYTFDAVGRRVNVTNAAGESRSLSYDALGRLAKSVEADGSQVSFSYDDRDNILKVIGPGGATLRRYAYSGRNQKLTELWPDGAVWTFRYDAAGRLQTTVDPEGQTTKLTYDDAGQVSKEVIHDDSGNVVKAVSLEYTLNGRISAYADGITSGVFAYDELSRKVKESIDYGPFVSSYAYEYYANSKKKGFSHPDGNVYGYSYDLAGRLSSISVPEDGTITFRDFNWRSPQKVSLPGGASVLRRYDGLLQLEEVAARDQAGSEVLKSTFVRDTLGRVASRGTDRGTFEYRYDVSGNLTAVSSAGVESERYTYDANGNSIGREPGDTSWIFDEANKLLATSKQKFQYDKNGAMRLRETPEGDFQYTFNAAGRLAEVVTPQGHHATYYYDPFGRRLWKEVNGLKTYFMYADEGLVAEFGPGGTVTRTFGWAPGSDWMSAPVFERTDAGIGYVVRGRLGQPAALLDRAGKLFWRGRYTTFGKPSDATSSHRGAYPGHYYDEETGLYYNYHRYYDPTLGRYISPDPIDLRGGLNVYVYARNDPVNIVDLIGLKWIFVGWETTSWEWEPLFSIKRFTYAKCKEDCSGIIRRVKIMGEMRGGWNDVHAFEYPDAVPDGFAPADGRSTSHLSTAAPPSGPSSAGGAVDGAVNLGKAMNHAHKYGSKEPPQILAEALDGQKVCDDHLNGNPEPVDLPDGFEDYPQVPY